VRVIRGVWRLLFPALLVAAVVIFPAGFVTETTGSASPSVARPPGGPILVIAGPQNPFSSYYAEILRAEGLNEFALEDVADVTPATLAAHDVAIVGDIDLTPAQVGMLSRWVRGGGALIAMRPDTQLAGLLGLSASGSSISDSYLQVDTSRAPGAGIVAKTMQFHGAADRYTLDGATSVADLYADAATGLGSPAVTVRRVGSRGGRAAAFTFDLARSIAYTRQGNPAWVGQERDGRRPARPDDLFFGGSSHDAQPDWVDRSMIAIPQADEQQRLLANLIADVTADKKPLPRFWYLPRGLKAVVVMTGDDHGHGGTAGRFEKYIAASPGDCDVSHWECIRGSSYIFTDTPLTEADAASYTAQGFEVGLHLNTGCADFTAASVRKDLEAQLADWKVNYATLPAPSSQRTHCVPWSDWASIPKAELAKGIRLDGSYYYWPGKWVRNYPGVFTGSGLPMRFTDSDGKLIDVYQAATQITDESGQAEPFTINTLLDRALGPEGYYGAFTANIHTDHAASADSDAIVAAAKARAVPVISGRQLLTWIDGRNRSAFRNIDWRGGTLSFRITAGAGAVGLRGMVPATFGGEPLAALTRDGKPIHPTWETVKGVRYAFFAARSGDYAASYERANAPAA
jgi:hypothetical protein